jgi:D-amino-acid dehydrogenase
VNTLAKLALCQYSQRELYRLVDEEGIEYDEHRLGALYLYRDDRQLELGMERMRLLAEHGQQIEALTAEQVARLDPAFTAAVGVIKGAIHGKGDGTGNSEKFTVNLAKICEKLGVEFHTGVVATELVEHHGRITGLRTDRELYRADNYVLALGVGSPFLSRTVGQNLPVYPAKGYSLTVDITDDKAAPTYGGVDEATLVAWSRFGSALRVSSTAEFDGYSRQFTPEDFANILAVSGELFPGAADWDRATLRSCMRPMTPDGPPIIGRGRRHENLYYNTGHGHMGWTMACGSSRALADLVLGRRPAIDMTPFAVRSRRR